MYVIFLTIINFPNIFFCGIKFNIIFLSKNKIILQWRSAAWLKNLSFWPLKVNYLKIFNEKNVLYHTHNDINHLVGILIVYVGDQIEFFTNLSNCFQIFIFCHFLWSYFCLKWHIIEGMCIKSANTEVWCIFVNLE